MVAPTQRSKAGKTKASGASQDIVVNAKALLEAPDVTVVGQTDAQRREAIAVAAYYLAQRRGFEPGHELEDWCAAEAQFDADKSSP
jgi:hypothetical protein